jgi:hypothetical protein
MALSTVIFQTPVRTAQVGDKITTVDNGDTITATLVTSDGTVRSHTVSMPDCAHPHKVAANVLAYVFALNMFRCIPTVGNDQEFTLADVWHWVA